MFPRVPRLLRLALLVGSLSLSLLLLLRAGGGQHSPSSHDLLRHRRLPSSAFQSPLMSAIRQSRTTPMKLKATELHRVNRTTSAVPMEAKATVKKEEEQVINPHPFRYLLNPQDACKSGHVRLLVYVHAAPANLKKRQSIRETWGQWNVLQSFNASLVFIMGIVPDTKLMHLVLRESETYGDIVQEDFLDTYRNLTYKAIAGLKWASNFCPSANYILKTDDDILVNLPRVVNYTNTVVEPQYGRSRLILCNLWVRMKIIRDKKSKWYVPEEDLEGDFFSPYCSGSAFLLSGDMARLLYEASLVTPFFWVDDYYITGPLVQHLNIKHRSFNKAYSLNPGVAEGKFRNDTHQELFFYHLHKLRVFYSLWRNMTGVRPPTTTHVPNVTHSNSVQPVARAA